MKTNATIHTAGSECIKRCSLISGIPSEATVYRVMTAIGITHRPNRKPNGITKADREARKSNLKNGKLYVSAIFDCYDLTAVGLSNDDNMRAELFAATVENNIRSHAERVWSKQIMNSAADITLIRRANRRIQWNIDNIMISAQFVGYDVGYRAVIALISVSFFTVYAANVPCLCLMPCLRLFVNFWQTPF